MFKTLILGVAITGIGLPAGLAISGCDDGDGRRTVRFVDPDFDNDRDWRDGGDRDWDGRHDRDRRDRDGDRDRDFRRGRDRDHDHDWDRDGDWRDRAN